MHADHQAILSRLDVVERERRARLATPGLDSRVAAIKRYQQRRFAHTYADLMMSARYGTASRFFLEELYGPTDFTRRDAQFARVVPALVKIFPQEIVDAVASLSELHALSETLDTQMGRNLSTASVDAAAYVAAWQATGQPGERNEQILLTVAVATQLDRLTRRPLLRSSLRLMRGPARAAGLADLQRFLETGFDTFRAMKGATEFTAIVESRERALASAMFSAGAGASGTNDDRSASAFALLPVDAPG